MTLPSRQTIVLGTAVMTLCLGMPLLGQARSSYDANDSYRYRSDHGQRWSDSRARADYAPGGYNDRYMDNDENVTDQWGDLDTAQDQANPRNDRTAGYWTNEGYRSNTSATDSRYRNNMRQSDDTIRRNIIDNLGEGTDRVQVRVDHGIATLSGMVLNREAMVEVVEYAYAGGARKVRNELRVFRHEERPWAEMSDRRLAREVRDELSWSPFVDNDPIRVNVRKGVVTLEGSVEDRSEMAAAVENAYEAGARRVDNRLRIAK